MTHQNTFLKYYISLNITFMLMLLYHYVAQDFAELEILYCNIWMTRDLSRGQAKL